MGIKDEIVLRGHAIECRINAEDAFQGFRPAPGRITGYLPPGGPFVRMDSHTDYVVPPSYDSLLGKLFVWAPTREKAIERMKRALNDTIITGIPTTRSFECCTPERRSLLSFAYNSLIIMEPILVVRQGSTLNILKV